MVRVRFREDRTVISQIRSEGVKVLDEGFTVMTLHVGKLAGGRRRTATDDGGRRRQTAVHGAARPDIRRKRESFQSSLKERRKERKENEIGGLKGGIGSLSGYLSLSLREAPPPCRLREVYPPGSKSLVLAGPDDGSGLDSKRISITVILGHPGLLNQYRLLTRNKAGEIDDRLANIEKAFEDTKSDIEKKMERAQQSTQDYIAQSQADFLAKKTFWSQEDFNHGVVGASEPIKSTKRKKWATLTPIRRLIPSYYVSSGNRKV
ncbi:hypothetical protein GQ457_13G028630 [Hibiscus cannabinus]